MRTTSSTTLSARDTGLGSYYPVSVGFTTWLGIVAVNAVHDHVGSALPNAPVVPDPAPRESRIRTQFAGFLRASAQRRARLANRLDPCSGRVGPVIASR